ncbi:MAG: RNA chaperone Hfq [Bryobacteraceae bacterium]|nr:RNA chaperone Hfq [Bryobacteraceae bacterium]
MAKAKTLAPDSTSAEPVYLKQLIEASTPVVVKLQNNSLLRGTIEYYDRHLIRLTRKDAPNLFVYKHEIKYLYEDPKHKDA